MSERLERLTLVRHGETVGQSSIRYYGATDIELSDLGREQVRRARDRLAGQAFEVVGASSLSRSSAVVMRWGPPSDPAPRASAG